MTPQPYIGIELAAFELVRERKISPLAFVALVVLHKQCDWESGIWHGSAYRITEALGDQFDNRSARRFLKELVDAELVKSFYKKGSKQDYSVLINNYPVRFGKWKGQRLDATATTDPKNPVFYKEPSGTSASVKEPLTTTFTDSSRTPASVKEPYQGHVTDTSGTPVSGSTPSVPAVPEKEPPPPPPVPAAAQETAPLPKAGGRVEGWIQNPDHEEMGIPGRAATEWLAKATAECGEEIVVAVLNKFWDRPQGFGGIKQPWAIFLKEAPEYLARLKAKRATEDKHDGNNRRAGERLKAKILAELEALKPTDTERATAQQRIDAVEAQTAAYTGREPGVEYYIQWQIVADPFNGVIAEINRERNKPNEADPFDYIPPDDDDHSDAAEAWRLRNRKAVDFL